MTIAAIAQTSLTDRAAGQALGADLKSQLSGRVPHALIVFASSRNNYGELLTSLRGACQPEVMVGCSSAGEFTSEGQGEGMSCAVALHSDSMKFRGVMAGDVREDYSAAAAELARGFSGLSSHDFRYRSALVLMDALAGHADGLVEELTMLTGGTYQFFGGGAGDDARFQETMVFAGTEARTNAVVALEILSHKPIGVGVRHGWQPATDPVRVTTAEGMVLSSLNAAPAVEVFDAHASATGQPFDHEDPVPFFLHNILGVQAGEEHRLRVPLGLDADGCVTCAAEIPAGTVVSIMKTTSASAAEAAAAAARDALDQLAGHPPAVALFFDCVATRLRLGKEFGQELAALAGELGETRYVGLNTYGQVARAEGQFSGFHNCTAVVCVIPA